jgi:hypothetical protein
MDDDSFLHAFEAASIPAESWTHDDHIRMAYLYLRDQSFNLALGKIRVGIRNLNENLGIPYSLTSGYHETMTIAWAKLIRGSMTGHSKTLSSIEFLDTHPELREKALLREYYSPELIMTEKAKVDWVEPDLKELPASSGDVA